MQRFIIIGLLAFVILIIASNANNFGPDGSTNSLPAFSPTGIADQHSQYRTWIADAHKRYPYSESEDKMWRVLLCESSARSDAYNASGPYIGLYQYSPATWGGNWNPYRNYSIYNAQAQIYATAAAWQQSHQSWWECYYK